MNPMRSIATPAKQTGTTARRHERSTLPGSPRRGAGPHIRIVTRRTGARASNLPCRFQRLPKLAWNSLSFHILMRSAKLGVPATSDGSQCPSRPFIAAQGAYIHQVPS